MAASRSAPNTIHPSVEIWRYELALDGEVETRAALDFWHSLRRPLKFYKSSLIMRSFFPAECDLDIFL
jgi:hypothetical protein